MKAKHDADRNIRTTYRPDGSIVGRMVRFRVNGKPPVEKWFPHPDHSIAEVRQWRDVNMRGTTVGRGTFAADVQEYLRIAPITPKTKKVRDQQLAFLCAQTLAGPVLTVKQWIVERDAARDAAAAGRPVPSRGRTLGETPRSEIPIKRWREILAAAFAPTRPDRDPAEFANTSNLYRTAARHVYAILDQDDDRTNPFDKIEVRPRRAPSPKGQDMRVIAEILKHVPTKFGRDGRATELRLNVLAWCNIEPEQLKNIDPVADFHDQVEASHEDIVEGAITLTCPARLKGRLKVIPAPLLKFLTPRGVEAMRAYAAESADWKANAKTNSKFTFSNSSLLKALQRASRQAQAALAKHGIKVDLSGMTVKQLRHSFLSAMTLATRGRVTLAGKMRVDPGVVGAAGHADAAMMPIYVQRIVREADRLAMSDTARYFDWLFTQPLAPTPKSKLRIVRG